MTKTLRLPCGFVNEKGEVYRDAVIKEMTGAVTRQLSKEHIQSSPIELYKLLLSHCLVSIGPEINCTPVMGNLPIADRDFLVTEIWKYSEGDDLDLELPCNACNHKWKVSAKLADTDVYEVPDEGGDLWEMITSEDKILYKHRRVWSFNDNETGYGFKSYYPRCHEIDKIVNFKDDPVDIQFKMICNVLTEFTSPEGTVSAPFDISFLDALPAKTLKWLITSITDGMPGLDMAISAKCPKCSSVFEGEITPANFTVRETKTGTRTRLTKRSGR